MFFTVTASFPSGQTAEGDLPTYHFHILYSRPGDFSTAPGTKQPRLGTPQRNRWKRACFIFYCNPKGYPTLKTPWHPPERSDGNQRKYLLGHTPERSDGEPEVRQHFRQPHHKRPPSPRLWRTSRRRAGAGLSGTRARARGGADFLSENLFSGEKKEALPKRASVYAEKMGW